MEQRVRELEELEERVETVWEQTRQLYEEELDALMVQRELEQAERWLSSYESTVAAEDYGVSHRSDHQVLQAQLGASAGFCSPGIGL